MPFDPARPKSAQNFIEFAATLPARVAVFRTDFALIPDLEHHVTATRCDTTLLRKVEPRILEEHGISLWNLCVRLKHGGDCDPLLMCLLRVFAFSMLDRHQKAATCTPHQNMRLLQLANSIVCCLLQHDMSVTQNHVCGWVFERAADYTHALNQREEMLGQDDVLFFQRLRFEYRLQRVMVSWKHKRLDIAQSIYEQLRNEGHPLSPLMVESCADLCLQIGRDLSKHKDSYQAVKWLESAFSAITLCDLQTLRLYAEELLVIILQHLTRALVTLGDEKCIQRALEIVGRLEHEYAGKAIIPFLKMEILNAQLGFDTCAYFTELQKVFSTIVDTEKNFNTVMAYALVLRNHDPRLACTAMDRMLSILLEGVGDPEWRERTIVARIWISLNDLLDQTGVQNDIRQLLDRIQSETQTLLSSIACHAVQVLIWKRIEERIKEENHQEAMQWCRLALHASLSNASEVAIAKLRRKSIMCAINFGNSLEARAQFGQMSAPARQDILTQYAMFKVALLDNDSSLATDCLEAAARHSSGDAAVLYACVSEAQSSDSRRMTIIALRKVLHNCNNGILVGIQLPALITCVAKLLICSLDEEDVSSLNVASELVTLFQRALDLTRQPDTINIALQSVELKWFIKTTFDLAIRYVTAWDRDLIITLLEVCIEFTTKWSIGESTNTLAEQSQSCRTLISLLLVKTARAEPQGTIRSQSYHRMHSYAGEYWRHLADQDNKGSKTPFDISSMHKIMLVLDFEACTVLGLWDQIQTLIEQITSIKDEDGMTDDDIREILENFTNMILASDSPKSVLPDIISAIMSCPEAPLLSLPRLACRLRVLYESSLKQQSDHESAVNASTQTVLNNVLIVIDAMATTQHPYPAEEVEWLVATTFNKAVDAYCASDKMQCIGMAEIALDLAQRVLDGGKLRETINQRLNLMVWDEEVLP